MLPLDRAVHVIARELAVTPPAPDAEGAYVFGLDESMMLGVLGLADGSALIAWSVASEPGPGESSAESEERAKRFLQTHLGRVRRCGPVIACRGGQGEGILYIRSTASDEDEWLRSVTSLLNETEMVRAILAGKGSGSSRPGGVAALFSGMSGVLGRR